MVKEKDLNFIQDHLLYINSKGKKVRRLPKKCLGGFYFLEAAYKNLLQGYFGYVPPTLIKDKKAIQACRQGLLNKILKELNGVDNASKEKRS